MPSWPLARGASGRIQQSHASRLCGFCEVAKHDLRPCQAKLLAGQQPGTRGVASPQPTADVISWQLPAFLVVACGASWACWGCCGHNALAFDLPGARTGKECREQWPRCPRSTAILRISQGSIGLLRRDFCPIPASDPESHLLLVLHQQTLAQVKLGNQPQIRG